MNEMIPFIFNKKAPYMRNLSYPNPDYPEVYSKEGRKLEFFYLQDQIMGTYANSRYFMWDRCNYGLKTHFYSHNNMLYTKGTPTRKYGILIESKQIVPDNYRIFDKYPKLAGEFDAVFTYDDRLLNRLENARFFPGCAYVWYGKGEDSFNWDPVQYQKKSKDISIVSSDKRMCRLHEKRIELARYCRQNQLADVYGTVDGGAYTLIDDSLKEYRYSIILENDVSDYFFTEKLVNCFASQTIPVYLGANKISEFFNEDGIVRIEEKDLPAIENILKICTREYYEGHLDAILDNFGRVFSYQNNYDWLYEHYFESTGQSPV